MTDSVPTALEAAVLERLHGLYRSQGFPDPASIAVKARVNTGAGRLVELEAPNSLTCADGFLDLNGSYIAMAKVPLGMQVTVAIEHGRPCQLEFTTFGEQPWDGVEREWAIRK